MVLLLLISPFAYFVGTHVARIAIAKSIAVGTTKEEVSRRLGKPVKIFGTRHPKPETPTTNPLEIMFSQWKDGPESWVYGYEFQMAWPFTWKPPFLKLYVLLRWRMFGPGTDDLVNKFDEDEKASEIIFPE